MHERVGELSDGILPFCRGAGLRKYNGEMADDLLRYRSQFPILERSTYLISNSLGAMPLGVYEAMKRLRGHLGHTGCAGMGRTMVDAGRTGG